MIELSPEPWRVDEYGTVTAGEWGGWLVQIVPMLFNNRIVLTPALTPYVYDYGWCYDKGAAAFAAVKVWDPETEAEPPGHKKAVVAGRRAGQTAGDGSPGLAYLQSLAAIGFDISEGGADDS